MFRQILILDMRSQFRFLKLFIDVLSIHEDIFLQGLLGLEIGTVKVDLGSAGLQELMISLLTGSSCFWKLICTVVDPGFFSFLSAEFVTFMWEWVLTNLLLDNSGWFSCSSITYRIRFIAWHMSVFWQHFVNFVASLVLRGRSLLFWCLCFM